MNSDLLKERTERIERELMYLHRSSIIGGDDLRNALGYKTHDAMRQAIVRGTIPFDIFEIDGRRGKFALISDIAKFLAQQSIGGVKDKKN